MEDLKSKSEAKVELSVKNNISDMLTHSRTVPGWCGDEWEENIRVEGPPTHAEIHQNQRPKRTIMDGLEGHFGVSLEVWRVILGYFGRSERLLGAFWLVSAS